MIGGFDVGAVDDAVNPPESSRRPLIELHESLLNKKR